jgi:hypothetical protein
VAVSAFAAAAVGLVSAPSGAFAVGEVARSAAAETRTASAEASVAAPLAGSGRLTTTMEQLPITTVAATSRLTSNRLSEHGRSEMPAIRKRIKKKRPKNASR